jgi:hypothetical protein
VPPDVPEEFRREVLIVEELPGALFGILLYEVHRGPSAALFEADRREPAGAR